MKRLRYGIAAATMLAPSVLGVANVGAFSFGGPAAQGGVITLTDDVSSCLVIENGETYTLNLDGHALTNDAAGCSTIWNKGTLTITGNGTVEQISGSSVPMIANEGVLTIENGTFAGAATLVDGAAYAPVVLNNGGELTINGGQYTANNIATNKWSAVVINQTGSTAINGGTFVQNGPYNAISADGSGLIEITDGTFTNNAGKWAGTIGNVENQNSRISISGGTINAYDGGWAVINFSGNTSMEIVGNTVINGVVGQYDTLNPEMVGGGTFTVNPTKATYWDGEQFVEVNALKDGYVSVENNSGKFEVSAFNFSVDSSASVEVGSTITISPEVEPSGYTPSGFSYVSKDPTTATVSDAGVVTGVAVGTAEIMVSSDFSVNKTVLVGVTAATSSSTTESSSSTTEGPSTPAAVALKTIELDKKSIELNKGGEAVLNITYGPEDFDLENLGYVNGMPKDFDISSSTAGSPFVYCYTYYNSDKDEEDLTKLVCSGYEAGSGKVVVTASDDDGNTATAEIDVIVKDALESGYAYIDDDNGNYVVAGANFEKPIEGADHLDIKFKALPEAQADNEELKLVVDIKVYDKNGEVVPVKDNKVTVTIQVEKAILGGEFKHFQIVYLDENGKTEEWFDPTKVEYDDVMGIYYITFETSHFSQYGVLASNTAFTSAATLNALKAPNTGVFTHATEASSYSNNEIVAIIVVLSAISLAGAAVFAKRK